MKIGQIKGRAAEKSLEHSQQRDRDGVRHVSVAQWIHRSIGVMTVGSAKVQNMLRRHRPSLDDREPVLVSLYKPSTSPPHCLVLGLKKNILPQYHALV